METPITVTALSVSDEAEQMIICSCDLVGVSDNLVADVRAKVKNMNTEIDAGGYGKNIGNII